MAEDSIEYKDTRDDAWTEDVAKLGWKRSEQFPGLVLRGKCPSCKHEDAINAFVTTAGTTFLKGKAPAKPPTELIACQCTVKHRGAPETPRAGCGRWGYVPVMVQ
jgi:hypothetical protein